MKSALLQTSQTNKSIADGKQNGSEVAEMVRDHIPGLSMTTEQHAQQVFDRIARGEFYLICENERPYVDHDFPFGAQKMVEERTQGMLSRYMKPYQERYQGPMLMENTRKMKEEKAAAKAAAKL